MVAVGLGCWAMYLVPLWVRRPWLDACSPVPCSWSLAMFGGAAAD